MENTPAVIYSLDHSRKRNLNIRRISFISQGNNFWVDYKGSRQSSSLDSDTDLSGKVMIKAMANS